MLRLILAAGVVVALMLAGVASAPLQPVPLRPAVGSYAFVSASTTPPTEAQCEAAGGRCFSPQAIRAAYNVGPLYADQIDGTGVTIAIVDSYGSDTIAHDLHVFDQAFGLQPMCGEVGVACAAGMPTFSVLTLQGSPATKVPPATSQSPGQESKIGWALETSLDVETAHAMAPMANILLVTTPTAENYGVQGFPQMMDAEQYVVDHHLAQVISQSFGSAEETFGSTQALQNLRYAFVAAAQSGVTVLAASGDTGAFNPDKQPVGQGGSIIPYPTVWWPASDPLVTGVGGTDLCTDPTATTARAVDDDIPPATCTANPGAAEVGWSGSGGGFSHVFARPGYQDVLPAGSTSVGAMRGVPDVALQADFATGALVYASLPPFGSLSNILCNGSPCSSGWYSMGGTSVGTPQWAGLVALAAQLNGGGLGPINAALYTIGAAPARYASDFFDVTTGSNAPDPSAPGYPATGGWDPITGLGTPNAANLVPDLVAALRGH